MSRPDKRRVWFPFNTWTHCCKVFRRFVIRLIVFSFDAYKPRPLGARVLIFMSFLFYLILHSCIELMPH